MGREEPIAREEESAAAAWGGKSKKKGFVVDKATAIAIAIDLCNEFMVNKKKGKKGGAKKLGVKNEDNRVVEEGEVDDAPFMQFSGENKESWKKRGSRSVFSASSFGLLDEEGEEKGDDNDYGRKDEGEDGEDFVAFVGRKKPSKSKKGGSSSGSVFSRLASDDEVDGEPGMVDNDDDDDNDDSVIAFSGKKKPSKSKKSGGGVFSSATVFDVLDGEEKSKENDNCSREKDEDLAEITFAEKKKKPSKGSKKVPGNPFGTAAYDEEYTDDPSVSKHGDDLVEGGIDDQGEDKFSVRIKSSKKKSNNDVSSLENGNSQASSKFIEPADLSMDVTGKKTGDDVAKTTSKNRRKKKKGGKAGPEDDDLDKILAELGGAPPVAKPAPATAAASVVPAPDEKSQNQPELEEAAGDKEAEERHGESLASKKKKKKNKEKEKEKEKKVAAAAQVSEEKEEEAKNVTKNKVADKKVSGHVRRMQEIQARRKEEEERKKREEEERLRREEEEMRLQEELEQQAEEQQRLKREKKKEKLANKKKEGKLLTTSQKEKARRFESFRNQILANAEKLQLSTSESSRAPPKKPLYQKKKSKPQTQSNGTAPAGVDVTADSVNVQLELASEVGSAESEESMSSGPNDNSEVNGVFEEDGLQEEDNSDDEDWDAKSWDDTDFKLHSIIAFADEEVDSEPEILVRKKLKNARPTTRDVGLPSAATKPVDWGEKVASTMPLRSQNLEVKKKVSESEDPENNINRVSVNPGKTDKKESPVKSETTKLEDTPVQSGHNLRSPICCIMGHVDTGKTKLLDCIRGTNVQEGEAGGITQQIGATYFPVKNIRERIRELKADAKLNVPGLLVIDTPGHESFVNLRTRGSGLCDIAVLVVDIMHGLEPQTIESLNLLKMRNSEFIVALNKVDRLYGWKSCRNAPIVKAMEQQSKYVQMEFNTRLTQVITQFKEQGLNTELYYKNKEMGQTFSIVPTSAISGEGIPDLLSLLVDWTQKTMIERLTYSNEVQCTILEVKVVEGHGTTIDVVLVNGLLREGDQIVVCGLQGPIVTSIRALLTPHPMKELRVKGNYLHHKEIKAAQGIKITAQGLEHAIAGTSLYVVGPDDDLEEIKEAVTGDMKSVMNRIGRSCVGVYVQASTLGSLEALLEFLKSPAVRIPVSGISIGPVQKKDVMKASVMLEKNKEYGTILAFDVKVTPEARELADELGVKIFLSDIIYHLFDQFKAYIDNLKEEKKKEAADQAVFPCVLKIIPNCVFNKKDPIVLGVDVLQGTVKVGTPICVPQKDFIDIGRIASIENNHKPVDYAKKGQKIAIKIIGSNSEEQQKMFGRHFEIEDELVSKISRESLDALKEHYTEDLTVEEKRLLFKLKKLFKIP